jgi:hypothetical protein
LKSLIKSVALVVLAAPLPGCRGGGAFLLRTALGASVVTAAVVSSRPPPPPYSAYAPPPRPGYAWQPGYWVLHDDRWEWIDGHSVAAEQSRTRRDRSIGIRRSSL